MSRCLPAPLMREPWERYWSRGLAVWSVMWKVQYQSHSLSGFFLSFLLSFLASWELWDFCLSLESTYQDNFLGIDPLSIPSKHLVSTFIIKDSKLFSTVNFSSVSLVPPILFHSHLLEHLYVFPFFHNFHHFLFCSTLWRNFFHFLIFISSLIAFGFFFLITSLEIFSIDNNGFTSNISFLYVYLIVPFT